MRALYWIIGGVIVLILVVGGVTFVALNRQRQAYTPGEVVDLGDTPQVESTAPATPRPVAATSTAEPGATPIVVPTASSSPASPTAVVAATAEPALQPSAAMIYDDFTRLSTGWAPLYLDAAGDFNGYSADAYLFDIAQPNKLLYDVQSGTRASGRYGVEIQYRYGEGFFGLMLDVQGDPNDFANLSYYMVGLTTQGTVVLKHHDQSAPTPKFIGESPPLGALLNAGPMIRLEVDRLADSVRVLVNGGEAYRAQGLVLQGGAIGLFAESGRQPLRIAFDNLLVLDRPAAEQGLCADIRPLFVPTAAARPEGEDVRILQQRLARLGYDVGELDGIFGPRTEGAVLQFQQRNGLAPDGIVGPQTWCLALSSAARTAGEGLPEEAAEQQFYRPVELNPPPELTPPLFVSVRQTDQSWRVALALPGRSDLIYLETEGNAYDPALSPDRRMLAFSSDRNSAAGIWLLDTGSGELRQVTPFDLECEFPVWSPDGRSLMFTAEPPGGAPLAARNYMVSVATGEIRKFSDEHTGWADWSAQNELVFTRWTGTSFDLFRANPDGSGLVNLTNTDDFNEDIPAWSPDGSQIVFVGSPRSDTLRLRQLFVMQRDGSGVYQLTSLPAPNSNPVWSPDGRTIAFANQPSDGVWQPWLISATGEIPRQLSANSDRIWFMSWSQLE